MQFENHQYYNCEIELNDGQRYKVSANWLHNNDLDHWQNWSCDAGYKRLSIDKDFNVYSAQCENEILGNIFTGWVLHDRPSVCKRETCTGCTDDLLTHKQYVAPE